MVDFRYHIVSLVSVFLALAVGIILGAGPLQNSIGNSLNSQVDTLRESREELRTQLDNVKAEASTANAALEVAAEQILPGTLTGRRVALVAIPGVDDTDLTTTKDRLVSAGAEISSMVSLTNSFASSEQATYRQALASQMASYVGVQGASTDAVVASALDYVLRTDPTDSNAKVLLGSLTADSNALLKVVSEQHSAAEVIVFLSPAKIPLASMKDTEALRSASSEIGAQVAIYAQAFATSASRGPAVGVGSGAEDGDILHAMREDGRGSTVDSVGTPLCEINTVIAVAHELTSTHVSLGAATGAEIVLGSRVNAAAATAPTVGSAAENG